ncbi:MAG TPA: hypothetical protein VLI90_17975 [Tepidisphaeraceae bacterium]|nr:hypothetical protein [Tepidisphaeraceae bacterium]
MATKKPLALRVLFIGNSFTARNDLPGLVALLADGAGNRLEHQLLSIGGASLGTHWNKGEARAAIEHGRFDYVVLQEQSTLPIQNATRMHENVRLFDPVIRAAGSKTALYMTWARKHAPQTQAVITAAYTSIAREIAATLIPAGIAWQRALRPPAKIVLHDKDGSHPTLAGSFLAACVAYRALFRGRLPRDVNVDGLTEEQIKMLQSIAGTVTI